jgi:hypothetical protein
MNPSAAKQTATTNRDNNKLLKITFRFIVSPEVKINGGPELVRILVLGGDYCKSPHAGGDVEGKIGSLRVGK